MVKTQAIITLQSGVSERAFVDSSIFRYDDIWWMFVNEGLSNCYLYYSDNLLSHWVEHPMSPIVTNNETKARPGGRAIVLIMEGLYE
ncbi:MAG: hypothetical protein ACUVWN_06700 [bacterium]